MQNLRRIVISIPDQLLQEFDGLVDTEKKNRSEFIREAMKLYISERHRRVRYEQMKNGYVEMAYINLSIAQESFSIESEVFDKIGSKQAERVK